MPFPKLNQHIIDVLEKLEVTEPLPFQDKILKPVKSGLDYFIIAPEGAGKTMSLVISVLQTLKCKAEQDSPRAMIFVKDKQAALALEEVFRPFLRRTDLRLFMAIEEHQIDNQKDEIYLGCDILIGTPKRLSKLFYLNGIHLGLLKMMIIEDAEFVQKGDLLVDIVRLSDSVKNCQFLIYADKMAPKLERLMDSYMKKARVIIS